MMDIVFLGTSSATPTPRRNVSSILVQMESHSLLVDAGEGTQRQILKSGMRRGRIDRILITHLHGDHFYGLIGLLNSYQLNRREDPLHIVGPPGLQRYLNFMRGMSQTTFAYPLTVEEIEDLDSERLIYESRDYRIVAAPLRHRITTIGYRIEEVDRPGRFDAVKADELGVPFGPVRGQLLRGQDLELEDGRVIRSADLVGAPRPGLKLAICTDTTYCKSAVGLAEGVDLLVHECTFQNADEAQARKTMHSTTADALRTATESGAKQLAITHFSTRYMGNLKALHDEARQGFPGLIAARDFLLVRLKCGEQPRIMDSRKLAEPGAEESTHSQV